MSVLGRRRRVGVPVCLCLKRFEKRHSLSVSRQKRCGDEAMLSKSDAIRLLLTMLGSGGARFCKGFVRKALLSSQQSQLILIIFSRRRGYVTRKDIATIVIHIYTSRRTGREAITIQAGVFEIESYMDRYSAKAYYAFKRISCHVMMKPGLFIDL